MVHLRSAVPIPGTTRHTEVFTTRTSYHAGLARHHRPDALCYGADFTVSTTTEQHRVSIPSGMSTVSHVVGAKFDARSVEGPFTPRK